MMSSAFAGDPLPALAGRLALYEACAAKSELLKKRLDAWLQRTIPNTPKEEWAAIIAAAKKSPAYADMQRIIRDELPNHWSAEEFSMRCEGAFKDDKIGIE